LALAGSDAAVSVILNLQRLPAHLRRDQKMSGPYDTTLWCLHGPGVRTPTATVDVKAGDCVRIRRHLLREPTRRPCTRCACRLVDGTEPSLTRRVAPPPFGGVWAIDAAQRPTTDEARLGQQLERC